MARDLTGPVPTYKPAGDITYLRTGQGWLSLATAVDLNTRMVVGWAMPGRMAADTAARPPGRPAGAATRPKGHLPQRPQQPARLGAAGVVGQGKRRGARLRWHRQPPRRRGGRVLPRDPQGRDVLPPPVYHARGGEVRRDRLIGSCYNRRRPHPTIGYRVPADVMDESFERLEGALSEPREVLRAA